MGLLTRFEKFLRDNYPGKSPAIKSTTVRILRDFTIALNDFVQENPNIPPEQILQNTNFHNKLILQDWIGKEIGGAGSIIPKVPDESKEDPYTLLFNIVWSMIRFELSYDPTIGTEKDIETVWDIVGSYIMEAHNYLHDNDIITNNQKSKKDDQELREHQERLKDPDGFTLKERQEWEQLLKQEQKQKKEKEERLRKQQLEIQRMLDESELKDE